MNWRTFQQYQSRWSLPWTPILTLSFTFIIFIGVWLFFPPYSFPEQTIIAVDEGQSLEEISYHLARENIIRSPLLFRITVIVSGGERGVIAGDYYFEQSAGVVEIADRLISGDHQIEPWRVTIPEGSTIYEMAAIFEQKAYHFDSTSFFREAMPYRGYLFPDTYEVTPHTTEKELVERMRETFNLRIQEIEDQISAFDEPFEDVMVMASILEEEGREKEDRRMIAGILWKRLELGIPLQVDASFLRVNGKTTYDLTYDDLEIDDPFNTYKNRGLPPQPITNPGLESIEAAVTPIESDYLYYLSERDGTIHYSETLDEHNRKKRLYVTNSST